MKKFDEHFVPKVNLIHERVTFQKQKQQDGKTVETCVRRLYELSVTCEFKDKEHRILQTLIIGMKDTELSEKLQITKDLKLDDAITKARQSEQIKEQIRDQREQSKHVESVNRFGDTGGQNRQFNVRGRGGIRGGRGRGYRSDSSKYKPKPQNTYNNNRGHKKCNKCNLHHAKDRRFAKGKDVTAVKVLITLLFVVKQIFTNYVIQNRDMDYFWVQ